MRHSRLFIASSSRPLGITRRHQHKTSLVRQFGRDQSGSYVIISALLMPVLVGTAGLGTEVGWWYYKHKNMQSAADSGAVSAATAASAGAVQHSKNKQQHDVESSTDMSGREGEEGSWESAWWRDENLQRAA